MKKKYFLNVTPNHRFFLFNIFFLIAIFSAKAQVITGINPYCIASNPTYTITPDLGVAYDTIKWVASNDSGITFSGNPSPKSLSKVVIKSGNIINAPHYIYAQFRLNGTVVYQTPQFNFVTAPPPVQPGYVVTKTQDYCTSQYHIIVLNVAVNPNPSPNTNFYISPSMADPSVIVTQTSKNVFELKLPLNGQNYFLYNIQSTTSSGGCLSNSATSTSYGNAVSLNLTNCANTSPGVNYDFSVAPNPYSNGYITIVASAISASSPGVCRIFNSSGTQVSSFSLTNSSTAYQLKAAAGAALTSGNYIVHVTYSNGVTRTKNLIVI